MCGEPPSGIASRCLHGATVTELTTAGWGRVIYVDDDAVGAGDGSFWIDAFVHLQDALAAEPGDEIQVAQGVCTLDRGIGIIPGDRDASFHLVSGVALAGGYAGLTDDDPDERDVERYETVLSGNLKGDDGDPTARVGDEPSPNGGIVNLGAYGGTAEASKIHSAGGVLYVDDDRGNSADRSLPQESP